MGKKNILYYISSLFILIFVFSIFNDNYVVEKYGDNSLKLLFLVFLLFYGSKLVENLGSMTLFQDKMFFLFAIALVIAFLLESIFDMSDDLLKQFMTILSLLTIVIYFSRYPLEKLLYFIWIAMMLSIMMTFFNDPLSEWTFRTSGGTDDPNEFAAQLLAFLFTSIYLFNINKSKTFLLLSVVFFTHAIFVAGSKSSFLMIAIVGVLLILKYIVFDIRKIINYKFLIAIMILSIAVLQIDFNKIQAVTNMQDRAADSGTFNTRLASWNGGYHMTVAHPLVGVGIGDYSKYTRQYATVYVSAPAPHNLFIKLIAESGVIVFLIFLAFLFFLFFENAKFAFSNNIFWIYLSFLSLLFMGMSIGITYDKYFLLYMAIMLNANYLIKKGAINEDIKYIS